MDETMKSIDSFIEAGILEEVETVLYMNDAVRITNSGGYAYPVLPIEIERSARQLGMLPVATFEIVVESVHEEYVRMVGQIKSLMDVIEPDGNGIPQPLKEVLAEIALLKGAMEQLAIPLPEQSKVQSLLGIITGKPVAKTRWIHRPPTYALTEGHEVLGPMRRPVSTGGWGRKDVVEILCGACLRPVQEEPIAVEQTA